jgi:hypothetical protein
MAYNNRGTIYADEGIFTKACFDFNKAADLGSKEAQENVAKFCSKN